MRVWVDLSNSPHVELFGPVIRHLEERGDDVVITVRDHAQTAPLAARRWPHAVIVGGNSPSGRAAKGAAIVARAASLARFAARARVDVALSHGSYAQIVAARAVRVPAITMMDYEFQPANHVSFRLAQIVVVPDVFPAEALARFAAGSKARRYPGYKEELYLAGFRPQAAVLDELGIDPASVLAVLRPPPFGALYQRDANDRFERVAQRVVATPGVSAVLLARRAGDSRWRALLPGVILPETAVDGPSLLALADLTIGAGGTMNRESALLGTPTYTVFSGRLAAVDSALIAAGRLIDLRDDGTEPVVEKKPPGTSRVVTPSRRDEILAVIDCALAEAAPDVCRRLKPLRSGPAGVPAPRPRPRRAERPG